MERLLRLLILFLSRFLNYFHFLLIRSLFLFICLFKTTIMVKTRSSAVITRGYYRELPPGREPGLEQRRVNRIRNAQQAEIRRRVQLVLFITGVWRQRERHRRRQQQQQIALIVFLLILLGSVAAILKNEMFGVLKILSPGNSSLSDDGVVHVSDDEEEVSTSEKAVFKNWKFIEPQVVSTNKTTNLMDVEMTAGFQCDYSVGHDVFHLNN